MGILEYVDDPLVSSDFRGNTHSCIFDALSTIVMADRMVKIMGWYDNGVGLFLPHRRFVRPDARQGHLTRQPARIYRRECRTRNSLSFRLPVVTNAGDGVSIFQ